MLYFVFLKSVKLYTNLSFKNFMNKSKRGHLLTLIEIQFFRSFRLKRLIREEARGRGFSKDHINLQKQVD